MRYGIALLIPLVLLSTPSSGANFQALIDSVTETYGGADAASRMDSFRVEAQVDARLRGRTGSIRRDFQAPNRLRVEIVYPTTTEIRVLDGNRGWRGDDRRLQRVEGLPKLAMVYQLLRSTIPWVFVNHRKLLEDRGTVHRGGRDYRVLGLPWSMELDLVYLVDLVSRRVMRVEGILRARGTQTVFATEYRDFRRVDGLLFAFAEENYASGRHTGTTRLSSVGFSPPDLGSFDPAALEP